MPAQPSSNPPWYASSQRLATLYADQGFANLAGSPLGTWVQTGGSVDLNAAAGPNGLPGFRFNAASGGFLENSTSSFLMMPFHVLTLARVRTPIDTGTLLSSSQSQDFGVFLTGTTQYEMTESAGHRLKSPTIDPTQWQLVDTYWAGSFDSTITISGGTRVVGDPFYVGWPNICIGGGIGGGTHVRMDVDVFSVEIWNGRIPYTQLVQYAAWLSKKTGVSIAAPASYGTAVWPPQLSSRPAAWVTGSSRTLYIETIGQSNDVGKATPPIVSLSSAVKMFNLGWQVVAASNPLKNPTPGVKDPASVDGSQTSGYQNQACNTIASTLGRTVTVAVDSLTGTTSTQWLPNASNNVPSTLFGAAIARMQEAQYWGQELGGVFVCQGENDTNGTVWLANWQAIIAKMRAILGLPRLPFFFTQTPSSLGVRTSEPNISDPSNNVFFITSVLNANLQGDNTHWTATGYDLAGQALSAQYLSGYPYYDGQVL